MKRILSILLVLVLALGVFTSCDNLPFDLPFDLPFGETPVEEADIQEVVKQLDDMYEDDNGKSIQSGTELIARLKLSGTEFTIAWTSDNENIKIELVDGLYVVTLPKNTEGNADYKLIATITSAGGQTATVEYNRVLAQSFGMITNPVAGTAYKLALLHGNEGGVVYFNGENYNNYAWYFAYTNNQLEAVDVYLETVEGVEGGYRLYFMNGDAKTYIVAYPRDNDTTKGTLKFDTAVPTEYFTYSTEYNTLVYTSVTGQQFYMGSSGTYKSISCSALSYITSPTSYPVRLYGAGGVEEKLPEQNLPELPENPTVKDIIDASEKLLTGQKLEVNFTLTGVITSFKYSYDPSYNNVSPKVTVEGKEIVLYRISGEGADTIKVGDTITVFVTGITRYSDSEWQTLSGGLIKEVVPGTGETPTPTPGTLMTIPEVLASAEGTNVVVKGTVESFYYAWSDEFNNCSVYIKDDAGNKLLCFRLKTKVAIGDQITVTGTATVYNGTVQIAEGCTATIDVPAGGGSTTTTYGAPVAGTAYKLFLEQVGLSKTLYFNGVVNSDGRMLTTTELAEAAEVYFETTDGGYHIYLMVDGAKQYVNTAPYINDSGYIKCRMALADAPNCVWKFDEALGIFEAYTEFEGKNDTFFMGTYGTFETISLSGAYYKSQITSGTQYPARLVLSDGTTPPAGGGSGTDTPVTPPVTGSMTIADALKAPVGTSVVLTGTVSKVKEVWSSQFNNISVYLKDDAGNEILLYRLSTKVALGDVITVTGTIGVYGEENQIAQGATAVINTAHTCEYAAADCLNPSKCHCDKVAEGSTALGHTSPDEDGCCTRCGANVVASYTSVSLSFADKANRTTFTTSQQVWEQNGIVLTNDKGSSTSNVADYGNPARFYKSSKITVEYDGMAKIDFICNSADYATALKAAISGTGITVLVNGATVTVQFDEPVDSFVIASLTGGQVRMNSITIYTLSN